MEEETTFEWYLRIRKCNEELITYIRDVTIDTFILGLAEDVQEEVRQRNPKTIEEALRHAVELENHIARSFEPEPEIPKIQEDPLPDLVPLEQPIQEVIPQIPPRPKRKWSPPGIPINSRYCDEKCHIVMHRVGTCFNTAEIASSIETLVDSAVRLKESNPTSQWGTQLAETIGPRSAQGLRRSIFITFVDEPQHAHQMFEHLIQNRDLWAHEAWIIQEYVPKETRIPGGMSRVIDLLSQVSPADFQEVYNIVNKFVPGQKHQQGNGQSKWLVT